MFLIQDKIHLISEHDEDEIQFEGKKFKIDYGRHAIMMSL